MKIAAKINILYGIVLFLDVLEMTLLNIGLPSIANDLQIPAEKIDRLVTAFIWGLTLMIPLAGWLGQRYGNKNIFIWGQLLFLGGSIGCFYSQSLFQLTLFRTIQGFGGGLIIPVGLALLMSILSANERAAATARLSLILRLAPAVGPVLGGYTLAYFGWRWLFLLKLPVAAICFLLSFMWLEIDKKQHEIKKFDFRGLLFCSLSLGSLLMAASSAELINICLWCSIGLTAFRLFIKAEKQAEAPIIPLQLFENKHFCQTNLLQALGYALLLGSAFLFSLFFQESLKLNSTVTGWILASSTIGMFLAIPIVSILFNRVGPKPLVLAGFTLSGICLIAIACITYSSPIWIAAFMMVGLGLGNSIIISTNASSVFTDIPKEQMGPASSVYSLTRQVANCIGIAISGLFLAITPNVNGAIIALSSIALIGVISALPLNNKTALSALNR